MEYEFDWSKVPFESPIPNNYYEVVTFPELLSQLREHFWDDNIEVLALMKSFHAFKKEYRETKGGRTVLTSVGLKQLKSLYQKVSPYRGMMKDLSEFDRIKYQFPEEMRNFYDTTCQIIDIYDSLSPDEPALGEPKKLGAKRKVQAHVDRDELSTYFNAIFKGLRGNPDYFSELVKELESLTSSTDLGRVAYLIYNSTEYVVKRHATFSEWMRAFFKIVDVRCPKDVRENKYKPNATFKNRFYFLPYNDHAHDDQTQG